MRPRGLLHRAANAITVWGILAGIPRPPYTRRNALVVETTGRRSGRRRRVPVGFLEDAGKVVVVVEDGRLKVHFKGEWHEARLRVRAGGPEEWLRRMGRVHAALVRRHSTAPGLVEIELF